MTTAPIVRTARVVVGVDGSAQSRQALQWSAFLAHSMQASLEAIISWEWGALGYPEYRGQRDPAADARKIIDQTLDEVFGEHEHPADLKVTVRQGYPARTLMDACADAGMLVVGSRGHGGFAGLLLGSVSAACAEHAACPVLVVHSDTPAPQELPRRATSGNSVPSPRIEMS